MVTIVSKEVTNKKTKNLKKRSRDSKGDERKSPEKSIVVYVKNLTPNDITLNATGVTLPSGVKTRFLRSVWSALQANVHVSNLEKTNKIKITQE